MTRQDNTTRQDDARPWHGKTRKDKTRRDETRQDKVKRRQRQDKKRERQRPSPQHQQGVWQTLANKGEVVKVTNS